MKSEFCVMFFTILTSIVVSTFVWVIMVHHSSIFRWVLEKTVGTKYKNLFGNALSKDANKYIGDIYAAPPAIEPINDYLSDEKDELVEELKKFEEITNHKILFINHRTKDSGFVGINLDFLSPSETLSIKDAIAVIDLLRDVKDGQSVDLILNTTGGSMMAAEIIINALRNHHIRVFIPHHACSAGFLIALAADEIYLEKNAFVSSIDPQFIYGSASRIARYAKAYSETSSGWVSDLIRLIAGDAETAIKRIGDLLKRMLGQKYSSDQIDTIFDEFASGKYNHDKPFFYADICNILTNVQSGIPSEIWKLYQLHNNRQIQ